MDQHEAYLRRRAARAEARRRERDAQKPADAVDPPAPPAPSEVRDEAPEPRSEPTAEASPKAPRQASTGSSPLDADARAIEQFQADQLRAREVARMKSLALKKRSEEAVRASVEAEAHMRRVEEAPLSRPAPVDDDAEADVPRIDREAAAEDVERQAEAEDADRQAHAADAETARTEEETPPEPEAASVDVAVSPPPTERRNRRVRPPKPQVDAATNTPDNPAEPERTPEPTPETPMTLKPSDRVSPRAEPLEPAPIPAADPVPPAEPADAVETPITTDVAPSPPVGWDVLPRIALNARHLESQRLISAARQDPAHVAFDVLRTRLLAALRENGWRRVAITSPTKDCGKSFVAANLAISLSRQTNCYTILSDLDLRRPSLARMFGARDVGKIGQFLNGDVDVDAVYSRVAENDLHIGDNLALGLNRRPESYAAELLQGPETGPALARLDAALDPDVHLFDLPPALYHDDVLAFRPHYDGVLLVVGGGITKPNEVREVKRRLGEETPLLGVVMNQAEGLSIADYNY